MKRLLFVSLFVPLLFAAAPPAPARQGPVEYRQGDAFRGPVRSARIEQATFGRVDGRLVEGPRRLTVVNTYTPDGKGREYEGYGPDGALRQRYVYAYDDSGKEVEMSSYDAGGKLLMRKVSDPSRGEDLTYDGAGELRERRVVVKGPDGKLSEVLLFDGAGALRERSVNAHDDKTSVWSTYGADGTLRRQDTHSLNRGGPHRTETKTYAPDGSAAGRRVSNADAGVRELRATEAGVDGGPPLRTRETREYDARGNLSKLTAYRWNAEAGGYEPYSVTYYTLEYYR